MVRLKFRKRHLWLCLNTMTNNISMYFHIPFCVRKCDYCAFYSLANQGDEIKKEYFDALLRQLNFFETDKTVSTVYFGGGTPPLMGTDRICSIIRRIKERFNLAQDCEITVEINPGTVDKNDLKALFDAGVNRLSIGIQSADDGILKLIGRIHSFMQAENCILYAREVGFENISADVIFALPNQTNQQFIDGLNKIIDLGVEHISAYSLQLEEGTPLFERASSLLFPDEDLEEEQYGELCRILNDQGFIHYEVSSFCKPNFQSRHNMNYWLCGDYFGFGAAAHSFYDNKRFSAAANVGEFIAKSYISLYEPTDFCEKDIVSPDENEEERIMLGLRTNLGAEIPKQAYSVAEKIAKLGYGKFENGVLTLNDLGFRVSNEIISEILI